MTFVDDRDLMAGPVDPDNPERVYEDLDPVLYTNGVLLQRIRAGEPYDSLEDIADRFAGDLPCKATCDGVEQFLAVNGRELDPLGSGRIIGDPEGKPASEVFFLPQRLAQRIEQEAVPWGENRDVTAACVIVEVFTRRGSSW